MYMYLQVLYTVHKYVHVHVFLTNLCIIINQGPLNCSKQPLTTKLKYTQVVYYVREHIACTHVITQVHVHVLL